jgi:ssDNA-binding Zn-finger/Zn-ribbon topoisomerase 1
MDLHKETLKNWNNFIFYLNQKYFFNNSSMDKKCPKCHETMVLRISQSKKFLAQHFWGCKNFPSCRSIEVLETKNYSESLDNPRKAPIGNQQLTDGSFVCKGICNCVLNITNCIFDSTPEYLLKEYISILYWTVSLDEELFFILIDKGIEQLPACEWLYRELEKNYNFTKLYSHHHYWRVGLHLNPQTLFCMIKSWAELKNRPLNLFLPSLIQFKQKMNILTESVFDFFSKYQNRYPIGLLTNHLEKQFRGELDYYYNFCESNEVLSTAN